MKTIALKGMIGSAIIALGAALILLASPEGWAQQKRKLSFKLPVETSKYTRQHVFDIGDVPGHQIRIYELHRTWPTNPPRILGLRVLESWEWGNSDYFDLSGRHYGYGFNVLESGDKIFYRFDGMSQSVVKPDGSRRSTYTGVLRFTGARATFRGIQGTFRYKGIFDPKANLNEGEVEGEYWID